MNTLEYNHCKYHSYYYLHRNVTYHILSAFVSIFRPLATGAHLHHWRHLCLPGVQQHISHCAVTEVTCVLHVAVTFCVASLQLTLWMVHHFLAHLLRMSHCFKTLINVVYDSICIAKAMAMKGRI